MQEGVDKFSKYKCTRVCAHTCTCQRRERLRPRGSLLKHRYPLNQHRTKPSFPSSVIQVFFSSLIYGFFPSCGDFFSFTLSRSSSFFHVSHMWRVHSVLLSIVNFGSNVGSLSTSITERCVDVFCFPSKIHSGIVLCDSSRVRGWMCTRISRETYKKVMTMSSVGIGVSCDYFSLIRKAVTRY